jgi:putative Mg2+ transporter-C (MgtC) family protein
MLSARRSAIIDPAMSLPPVDFADLARTAGKILAAYLLAFPVGWEREREHHSVGLRTFPIVAMASCGFLLLGSSMGNDASSSRVLQGLLTGIGFIGGGAILKEGANVRGTATAASIWNTGAIGAAVALDRYWIAILLSGINLLTLRVLLPLKLRLDKASCDSGSGPQP